MRLMRETRYPAPLQTGEALVLGELGEGEVFCGRERRSRGWPGPAWARLACEGELAQTWEMCLVRFGGGVWREGMFRQWARLALLER